MPDRLQLSGHPSVKGAGLGAGRDGGGGGAGGDGLGLGELERDGSLEVTVGDALVDPPPAEAGGLDVLLVDVFADGALLPELRRPGPWRALLARLDAAGLLVANLSGGEDRHQAAAFEALQAARQERGWGLWVKELGRVRDCVSANRLAVAAADEPSWERWRADLSAAGFDAPGRALTAAVKAGAAVPESEGGGTSSACTCERASE